MNEDELANTWAALDPTPRRARRIEARVRGWLDARESSLTTEWLGLIRLRPIAGFSCAIGAACLLLLTTPLSWAALSVL